jgi:hypothetical protein
MKTTIKDNILHIEIPLHAPRPSATGKTLTVASSNGNKETEARINGKPVESPHHQQGGVALWLISALQLFRFYPTGFM